VTGPELLYNGVSLAERDDVVMVTRGSLGSGHSLEVPFVFGTLDAPTHDRFAGVGLEADLLSGQMMDAWLSFAQGIDLSHERIGMCPMYDAIRRGTVMFGRNTRVEDAPFEEGVCAVRSSGLFVGHWLGTCSGWWVGEFTRGTG
jgi:hypothetical protein